MNKTGWFYIFMIVTLCGSVAGGITALCMGNDTIAGVLFGYVGGGAVSMLSQLGGLKSGLPLLVGAALMATLTGCGSAPKPQVDIPCLGTCAIQAAACASGCIKPGEVATCDDSVEECKNETHP